MITDHAMEVAGGVIIIIMIAIVAIVAIVVIIIIIIPIVVIMINLSISDHAMEVAGGIGSFAATKSEVGPWFPVNLEPLLWIKM